MGLLNFFFKAKYLADDRNKYYTARYVNVSRDYYHRNLEGEKSPNITLKDQYLNVIYNSNKDNKWSFGPSVEFYQSLNPTTNPDNKIEFNIQKYRLEYRTYIGRYLMLNPKSGLSYFHYIAPIDHRERNFDFHILADYSNSGYGVRLAYDYGPMVNTGLYQYALDAGNNGIIVSPYIIKPYLKGRLGVTLFANYTYRFDMENGSLNINPKIETYLFKNWYFVTGGTYNFTQQQYREQQISNSSYYVEFSIKKKWGNIDTYITKREVVRFKVQAFKDENSNGIKDKYEQGVPHIKIRIKLTNVADQKIIESFPYDFTLLTNEKGIVTFNDIPVGFYDILINQLSELKEYFFVSKSAERIEMLKASTYYIPFQKAEKIIGQVVVKRRKFTKASEQHVDVLNIKVTAYNKQGDSYSAFTNKEGKFVIFTPGNNTYYLRIENVFGKTFKILKNDIPVVLTDSTSDAVVFNVVELNRQIRPKRAKPAVPDSLKKSIQKIKVLPGDMYAKTGEKGVEKDAVPDFEIRTIPEVEQTMVPGKFYVVVGEVSSKKQALKYKKVMVEQGINAYVGITNKAKLFYVFTNHYQTRAEAKA